MARITTFAVAQTVSVTSAGFVLAESGHGHGDRQRAQADVAAPENTMH